MVRTLFLVLICGITQAALGESAPSTQPADPATRELAVVGTWGELLQQPAIDLPGGGRVRLGIESREAPTNAAVLVYCLAEGNFQVKHPELMKGGSRLCGPVLVQAIGDRAQPDSLIKRDELREIRRPGRYLYAAWVDVEDPALRVQIQSLDGRPLAETAVKATPASFHAWYRWSADDKEFNAFEPDGDDQPRRFRVRNGLMTEVWPRFPDSSPIAWLAEDERERRPKDKDPLPRLATIEPDPDLKLSIAGRTLTLRRERGLHVNDPRQEVLVRWWVNDRPHAHEGLTVMEEADYELREQRMGEKEVRLELDFAPERLRAEKGDRVKLQLLHTPNGWDYSRREGVLEKLEQVLLLDEDLTPRASNTVEFTVD